jgi:hypothetical protein
VPAGSTPEVLAGSTAVVPVGSAAGPEGLFVIAMKGFAGVTPEGSGEAAASELPTGVTVDELPGAVCEALPKMAVEGDAAGPVGEPAGAAPEEPLGPTRSNASEGHPTSGPEAPAAAADPETRPGTAADCPAEVLAPKGTVEAGRKGVSAQASSPPDLAGVAATPPERLGSPCVVEADRPGTGEACSLRRPAGNGWSADPPASELLDEPRPDESPDTPRTDAAGDPTVSARAPNGVEADPAPNDGPIDPFDPGALVLGPLALDLLVAGALATGTPAIGVLATGPLSAGPLVTGVPADSSTARLSADPATGGVPADPATGRALPVPVPAGPAASGEVTSCHAADALTGAVSADPVVAGSPTGRTGKSNPTASASGVDVASSGEAASRGEAMSP